MKSVKLLLILLLFSRSVIGQDTTFISLPARLVVKAAPLALIEFDPLVQLGAEYQLTYRRSLQVELGYGWSAFGKSVWHSDDYVRGTTWRGQVEWRNYSGRFRTNNRKQIRIRTALPLGNYWGMHGFAKQVDVLKRWREEIVDDRGALVGVGPERLSPVTKTVYGLHVKIGRQFPLFTRNDQTPARVLMDVYIGTGVRLTKVDHQLDGRTPGYMYRPTWLDRLAPHGWRGLPGFTAGIKIGYAAR